MYMTQYILMMGVLQEFAERNPLVTIKDIQTGLEHRILVYTPTIGSHPIECLFDVNGDLVSISTYQIAENRA